VLEGKELDAAVAREVLKLENVTQGKNHKGMVGPLGFMCPPEPEVWYYFNKKFTTHTGTWPCMDYLPDYSRDIYSAWDVVEKMYELGYSYYLLGIPASRDHQCYFALPDKLTATAVRAATAPLAICRAALAALGEVDGRHNV
jgi:hypothetical protein